MSLENAQKRRALTENGNRIELSALDSALEKSERVFRLFGQRFVKPLRVNLPRLLGNLAKREDQ